MKPSSDHQVREMYDETADSYSAMMDSEIDLPLYAEALGKLSESIAGLHGPLIDTSCGSGHMLSMYRERLDAKRPLIGVDLSPRMVTLASTRLGPEAEIRQGDMRNLEFAEAGSAAGIISFFAIHHLDREGVLSALQEWRRVTMPGGRLLLAAWEGTGAIDYGNHSDIVALRFTSEQISTWAKSAGFTVERCVVEPVEGMEMDAVYLEASGR